MTAVDVLPAMIAALREKATAAGLASLRCARAGFLSYSHDGPPADGVYTRNALHQLPDFWKGIALRRIAEMLRPGGVLRVRDLVYDFQPGEAAEVFGGWLANAADDPAAGYTAADYAEHIRTEYSTYRWLFEPLLAAADFEIVSVSYERRLYGAGIPVLAAYSASPGLATFMIVCQKRRYFAANDPRSWPSPSLGWAGLWSFSLRERRQRRYAKNAPFVPSFSRKHFLSRKFFMSIR